MKIGFIRSFFLIISMAVIFNVGFSVENETTIINNTNATDIKVQLTSSKSHVLIDEPFWLTFSIVNIGNKNINVVRCDIPQADYLNYEITTPDKKVHKFVNNIQMNKYYYSNFKKDNFEYDNEILSLQPGDSYSRTDDDVYESFSIIKPGKYIYQAIYSLPKTKNNGPLTIRSNSVCIFVEKPVGIDKKVYDAISNIGRKYNQYSKWSVNEKGVPEYEIIISKYPKSKYIPYMIFYLADEQHYLGIECNANNIKKKITYYKKAIDNYDKAANMLKNSYLAVLSQQYAGRCYANLNQIENAEEKFRAAFCSPGASTELQMEIISWLVFLEEGKFYVWSKLAKPCEKVTNKVMLPLLPYANALGYQVMKDEKTGESFIIKGDYKCVIKKGEVSLLNCKDETHYEYIRIEQDKDGSFLVSTSVIAMLMAERYGRGMGKIMSYMMTKVE